MVFGRNFSKKTQIWVSEPHVGDVRVDVWPWLMAHWKAFSIRVNWTFFGIYFGSGAIRRNVYNSAVFTGGRPLCTQLIPGQDCPSSTILGIRKLHTLGYATMKTASLCVTEFWHNAGVWRTDRQTDRRLCPAYYSACKPSFAASCKKLQS